MTKKTMLFFFNDIIGKAEIQMRKLEECVFWTEITARAKNLEQECSPRISWQQQKSLCE